MNKSFFLFANYCQSRQWCLLLRWTNASFCKRTFFSDVYNFARFSLDSNINASGWSIKIKRNEYPSENVIWKDLDQFSKEDAFFKFFIFLFLFVLFIIYFWFVCNKISFCFLEQLQHWVPGGRDERSGRLCGECASRCPPGKLPLPKVWGLGRWQFACAK